VLVRSAGRLLPGIGDLAGSQRSRLSDGADCIAVEALTGRLTLKSITGSRRNVDGGALAADVSAVSTGNARVRIHTIKGCWSRSGHLLRLGAANFCGGEHQAGCQSVHRGIIAWRLFRKRFTPPNSVRRRGRLRCAVAGAAAESDQAQNIAPVALPLQRGPWRIASGSAWIGALRRLAWGDSEHTPQTECASWAVSSLKLKGRTSSHDQSTLLIRKKSSGDWPELLVDQLPENSAEEKQTEARDIREKAGAWVP
jgi:hypothetical protein